MPPDPPSTGQPTDLDVARAFRVLAVNPGSTSTKVAAFELDRCVHDTEVQHEVPMLATLEDRRAQVAERTRLVLEELARSGLDRPDAVVGRGGFLERPTEKLAGGTYVVAEKRGDRLVVDRGIVSAVLERPEKEHASNLGIPVAAELAQRLDVPAFVVDPVVVDEFSPVAEISGYAPVVRKSTSHALSVRATARKAAEQMGLPLAESSLVVAHMGGGITVAAVHRGRMVDNSIALLGGGPFTPQRAGHLDLDAMMDLCFSGRFTRAELTSELTKRGGLQSYLGEHRMEVIQQWIEDGDPRARLVVEAMIYQIAKEIGAMYVAIGCRADAIALTGGLARSEFVVKGVRARVERLAPVLVFPGSLEMAAMAAGAVAVLSGREQARRYKPPGDVT